MGRLIYSAIASLDGYTADADGSFDWAAPDEEVHTFVNDLERPIGTYLYGRRMYEVMTFWETVPTTSSGAVSSGPSGVDQADAERDYAEIWQQADKVVYSTTLATVSSARTRIERSFAPDAVQRLKDAAARDISIGGSVLAARAIEAGLVDECCLFITPVVVGGGLPAFGNLRARLELLDEHRFRGGVVYLRYSVCI